jgi:hypothetical protein
MLTPEQQTALLRSADNVRQAAEHHLGTYRNQQSVVTFVSNLQRGVSRLIHVEMRLPFSSMPLIVGSIQTLKVATIAYTQSVQNGA